MKCSYKNSNFFVTASIPLVFYTFRWSGKVFLFRRSEIEENRDLDAALLSSELVGETTVCLAAMEDSALDGGVFTLVEGLEDFGAGVHLAGAETVHLVAFGLDDSEIVY